mgnify:CR=1 FL=1|tara:strand:+ start:90 stop:1484 length:1395 start_codon:yes stop_codon:yes gene_type:complete
MLKKLVSHTLIYGLAQQVPKIAALLSLPIITKYLTEIDFGVYGIITATVASVSALSNLGLNVVVANVFYKHANHYKLIWRQLYGFLILWNFIYSIILGLIIYLFIPVEAKEHTFYIIGLNVLPFMLFGPTALFGQSYYQYKQQPMQIAIRSIIFGLLSVVLNIILIAYYNLGYLGWFISIAIASVGSNLSYFIPLNFKLGITPILLFKRRYLKNALKISLPLVPHYYSNYLLNSSDQLIMKLLGIGTNDIGKYNASYMIGNVFQQIGIAAGKAVGPMLYETYKNRDPITERKIIFNTQAAFLTIAFSFSLWMKEIFYLAIKNEVLSNMYVLGIIIVMSYTYRPMYQGANSKLFFLEKTKILLKITFIAGISNVILNIILIPYFGFKIAAITTYASLMYMGYVGYFLKDFRNNNTLKYYPIQWLLTTIILTLSVCYLVEINFIFKIIITLLTLLVLFFFLKKINT